jgi:dTDP-4-amino-4,6-dideoxygalactose transaminase
VTPVYHIYAIRIRERDSVMRSLADKGICTGVHYPVPIHLQEAYRELGYGLGSFPIAEKCAEEFLSLPMFPELTREQLDYVVRRVKESLESVATEVTA